MSHSSLSFFMMQPKHFPEVITLANQVHGDGYLNNESIVQWYEQGVSQSVNTHFVCYAGSRLVGFRITFLPEKWLLDRYCSVEQWPVTVNRLCYFKCITVDPDFRQQGIGKTLLSLAIEQAKQAGATAGLSHIWLQSPGNGAFSYMSKAGGRLISTHPNKWAHLKDYHCLVCDGICTCEAGEMLLLFSEHSA